MNGSPGYENGAFESIGHPAADTAGDRGNESLAAHDRVLPGVDEEEAACAVGVLYLSGLEASPSEKGRLLVAGDTADRYRDTEEGRIGEAEVPGTLHSRGKHAPRNIQNGEQFVVPVQGMDIEKKRPGRIRVVSDMEPAAAELVDQPAVYRAEEKIPVFRLLPGTFGIVQDPF